MKTARYFARVANKQCCAFDEKAEKISAENLKLLGQIAQLREHLKTIQLMF